MLYCYTYKCKLSDDMLSESDDMLSVESNDMLCGIQSMICFSVESDHMLISVESKKTINSVDNPYVLICEAIY